MFQRNNSGKEAGAGGECCPWGGGSQAHGTCTLDLHLALGTFDESQGTLELELSRSSVGGASLRTQGRARGSPKKAEEGSRVRPQVKVPQGIAWGVGSVGGCMECRGEVSVFCVNRALSRQTG